jgi:hypothetical protein
MRDLEQRLEADQNLAGERAGQLFQQFVAEGFNAVVIERRQLGAPDQGDDVQAYVLLVVPERCAFDIACLGFLKPRVSSLGYRRAFAWCDVSAFAHLNLDRCLVFVGILLALKCLDVPDAHLIDIIDNPGLLLQCLSGSAAGPPAKVKRCNPLITIDFNG